MVRGLARFFIALLKIGVVIATLAAPIIAGCDLIDPWPASDEVRLSYSDEYVFLPVGGSWTNSEREAQSALLIPKKLAFPKAVYVYREIESVSAAESFYAFWFIFGVLIFGWYLIGKFAKNRWRTPSET